MATFASPCGQFCPQRAVNPRSGDVPLTLAQSAQRLVTSSPSSMPHSPRGENSAWGVYVTPFAASHPCLGSWQRGTRFSALGCCWNCQCRPHVDAVALWAMVAGAMGTWGVFVVGRGRRAAPWHSGEDGRFPDLGRGRSFVAAAGAL